MTEQIKPHLKVTRRKLAKLAIAVIVITPAAGVVALKLKDNPLREVKKPHLKLEGGWVLDVGDMHNGDSAGVPG